MLSISEIYQRIKFWTNADRIGPDVLLTHWRLHFKSTMRGLCVKKFKHFGVGADFRPGAYAEACSKISIGENVVIAGQVGFVGHISIGNFSQIGAQAGITKDLPAKSKVTGTPAEPIIEHYRNLVKLRNLNKKD
jgi:acetyltransferase-like isoleucine patch superfamily enzyme